MWVTNTSDANHEDGYHGKSYSFPVGVPVEIPDGMAEHCFGHGREEKAVVLARLGWTRLASDIPKGLERLAAFKITDERPDERSKKVVRIGA